MNDHKNELLERLEKTASVGSAAVNYLKNISGANVRRAEKAKNKVNSYNDPNWGRGEHTKAIANAKVDRNKAMAGTAGVVTAGGATLGGYKGYQDSKDTVTDNIRDLNTQSTYTNRHQYPQPYFQQPQQFKVAQVELLERLEKVAAGRFGKLKDTLTAKGFRDSVNEQGLFPASKNLVVDKGKWMGDKLSAKDLRDAVKQHGFRPTTEQGRSAMKDAWKETGKGYGLVGASFIPEAGVLTAGAMKSKKNNEEEMENVANELIERLDKTANEAYESRLADDRITEIIFDLADKDPKYLESALQAEGLLDRAIEEGIFQDATPGQGALGGGLAGGFLGGLAGGTAGAISGGLSGGPRGAIAGGLTGTGVGALGGGTFGAGVGAAEGLYRKFRPSEMHLKYHGEEENPRQGAGSVSNAPAGVDKSASELIERLDKTANEGEPGRQDRRFLTESIIGGGPVAYFAKKHNSLGVNEEDSHALANAKANAVLAGSTGALQGGAFGGLMAKGSGKPVGRGAMLGAAGMGLYGAGVGALAGAIPGMLHDRWDENNPVEQPVEEPVEQPVEEEQLASEDNLLDRLEKTANLKAVGAKAKDYLSTVSGKKHKDATKAFNTQNTPEALKANAPQVGVSKFRNNLENLEKNVGRTKIDQDAARKMLKRDSQIAGGGALVGAGVGAAAASGQKKEASQKKTTEETTIEKTASEQHDEMMNGLYKEAAEAIMNDILPAVKQHVDPLDRIKF